MSKGGRAIMAMPSTTGGGKISKIVPFLDQGSAVTTSRNDVNYVVTEYGIAQLRGKNLRQRAEELIAIAHPDFRDELRAEFRRRYPRDYWTRFRRGTDKDNPILTKKGEVLSNDPI